MPRRPLTPEERAARNAKQRERYANDPEFRDKMKALAAERYAEKGAEIKQRRNDRYANDPNYRARRIELSAKWQAEHPDRANEWSRNYHARKRKEAKERPKES